MAPNPHRGRFRAWICALERGGPRYVGRLAQRRGVRSLGAAAWPRVPGQV